MSAPTSNTLLTKPNLGHSQDEQTGSSIFKRKVKIWLALGSTLVTIVAVLFCYLRVLNLEQQILGQHRDVEQVWVDNTLESIRGWHGKLTEQIHYISQAEMFRLFVMDVQKMEPDEVKRLSSKSIAEDPSDPLFPMSELMTYLGDLLQDTVGMRGWLGGRIISADGMSLVVSEKALPMSPVHEMLLKRAGESKSMAFSALYRHGDSLVFDVVDPLFEVLGDATPKVVGFLLLTVPVDTALADFMAENKIVDASYHPSILFLGQNGISCTEIQQGRVALIDVQNAYKDAQTLPFGKRKSVSSGHEVWSMGGHSSPVWNVVLERPVALVDQEIFQKSIWIYGIGILASLGVSLVVFIFVNQAYFKGRAARAQRCIEGLVHGIECALDGQDSKASYLQGRSQKIDKISSLIGQAMHCSETSLETMRLAARLSQVGKIFVPRDLMTKKGVFTNEERRQVQMAPYHAFNVLKGMLPDNVATTIYQMGGKIVVDEESGEIRDLAPEEMTPEARILMVSNDFCAMVSKRGTRAPLSYPEARQKLRDNRNYDAKVVAALQEIPDEALQQVINDGEMSLEV